MGRLDRDKVQVEVVGIMPYKNDKYAGIKLIWSGNIGFGEYEIYSKDTDKEGMFENAPDDVQEYMYTKWNGQSEYMDSSDDKWFIRLLMDSLIQKMEVDN